MFYSLKIYYLDVDTVEYHEWDSTVDKLTLTLRYMYRIHVYQGVKFSKPNFCIRVYSLGYKMA